MMRSRLWREHRDVYVCRRCRYVALTPTPTRTPASILQHRRFAAPNSPLSVRLLDASFRRLTKVGDTRWLSSSRPLSAIDREELWRDIGFGAKSADGKSDSGPLKPGKRTSPHQVPWRPIRPPGEQPASDSASPTGPPQASGPPSFTRPRPAWNRPQEAPRAWGDLLAATEPRKKQKPAQSAPAVDWSAAFKAPPPTTKPVSPKAPETPKPSEQGNANRKPPDPWGNIAAAAKAKKNPKSAPAPAAPVMDWAAAFDIHERPSTSKPVWQQPAQASELGSLDRMPPTFGSGDRRRVNRFERGEVDQQTRRKRKARGGFRQLYNYADDEGDVDEDMEIMREERRRQRAEAKEARKRGQLAPETPRHILIPEYISVSDLSKSMGREPADFLQRLEELGFDDITEESLFTGETAGLVAQEFGFDVKVDDGSKRDVRPRPPPEDPTSVPTRPPIVAIMGHVDHGKTTLLDYLRKSSVAAQEHGGITQHIGAFTVQMSSGKPITFLDTPGHAAFLSMRQRGAEVTDIVVLVVAADDSVMPQTLEALKHARDAQVPIIVAITKVDKPEAQVQQVKRDLSKHGVELEDFGGDVQVVCVSGKTGQGMDDLEENIVTLSEMLDVRADTDGMAEGWVLEASVKPVGKAATVLVKRGTLRPGDCIVAGTTWARVRVMRNEAGQEMDKVSPGTPVEVLGWRDELPDAGDSMIQAPDEAKARTAVSYRNEMKEREDMLQQITESERQRREEQSKAVVEEQKAQAGEDRETAKGAEQETPGMTIVNFIIKGDVVGSVEAVSATVQEMGNHEVRPTILSAGAGRITESDVEYAATANAVIVNFNVSILPNIRSMADTLGVQIIDRNVIYHVSDDVRAAMMARIPVRVVQKVTGEAEVLQIFPINVRGRVYKNIAGCKIKNGAVKRSDRVRIMRGREKVFDGKLESLKHGKKDVTEMKKGTECGIGCLDYQDMQPGDVVQTYVEVEERRTL